MRKLMILSIIAAVVLACVPALADSAACSQQMLWGAWCMTCNGFTDLSNVDPRAPKGTLVPISMISRGVIDAEGKGTGKGMGSLAGTVFPFEMDETFKINSDCTGEKTYTLKIKDLGLSLPGKATVVFMPHDREFRIMTLVPGDVVSCKYKKLSNGWD